MSPRSRRAGAGLAGAPLAATLGLAASPTAAAAAVTGRVRAGTLEITGDRASDRLALRLAGAADVAELIAPVVDLGADG
jgi:hypothetical protein